MYKQYSITSRWIVSPRDDASTAFWIVPLQYLVQFWCCRNPSSAFETKLPATDARLFTASGIVLIPLLGLNILHCIINHRVEFGNHHKSRSALVAEHGAEIPAMHKPVTRIQSSVYGAHAAAFKTRQDASRTVTPRKRLMLATVAYAS